jgi:ribA/ribD-fused uncharacterized protein
MPIEFWTYKSNPDYFCFSNFYRRKVIIDGKEWRTTEHYYQATKFEDESIQEAVRACKTPREAADMGRDKTLPLRANWEEIKYRVMYTAVYAKFDQHKDLKLKLLNTHSEEIIEASLKDSIWGTGPDGKGANALGKILMRVRDKIMDYYLDHWLEYVLIRTQIPEILKAQHDDIGLTKAVQPAYFLYGIEKNDNGLAAARYAVHLGDELKLVSKKEADPNFVRWATLVDLQKWHEAWKQQLLKYQGTGNTPLPIGVYDENNNS